MIFTICCFLLTAPNREKIVSGTISMMSSVYRDIITCSEQKLKNFYFVVCLVNNHISPYF